MAESVVPYQILLSVASALVYIVCLVLSVPILKVNTVYTFLFGTNNSTNDTLQIH